MNASNEGLVIYTLRKALSPEFYNRNKAELDKLAFEIGIEQQEYKPSKENEDVTGNPEAKAV